MYHQDVSSVHLTFYILDFAVNIEYKSYKATFEFVHIFKYHNLFKHILQLLLVPSWSIPAALGYMEPLKCSFYYLNSEFRETYYIYRKLLMKISCFASINISFRYVSKRQELWLKLIPV